MKPKFTEKEIEELCDLYMFHGEQHGIYLIEKLLEEKYKFSKVNSILIDIRGIINKNSINFAKEREKNYPNSTLNNKLSERLESYE